MCSLGVLLHNKPAKISLRDYCEQPPWLKVLEDLRIFLVEPVALDCVQEIKIIGVLNASGMLSMVSH